MVDRVKFEPVRTPAGHVVWEHMVIMPRLPSDMATAVKAAGDDGWEFVQAIPHVGYVYMKRQKMQAVDDGAIDIVVGRLGKPKPKAIPKRRFTTDRDDEVTDL